MADQNNIAQTSSHRCKPVPVQIKKVMALACVPMMLNNTNPQGRLRLDKK